MEGWGHGSSFENTVLILCVEKFWTNWAPFRSSGMLRVVDWWLVTDVSGQPIGSHLESLGCPETSASKYQSILLNVPEERRPTLRRGGSRKSRMTVSFSRDYVPFCWLLQCVSHVRTESPRQIQTWQIFRLPLREVQDRKVNLFWFVDKISFIYFFPPFFQAHV